MSDKMCLLNLELSVSSHSELFRDIDCSTTQHQSLDCRKDFSFSGSGSCWISSLISHGLWRFIVNLILERQFSWRLFIGSCCAGIKKYLKNQNKNVRLCRVWSSMFGPLLDVHALKLKADRLHPRNYLKHRQTPQTDNDSSMLFAALGKTEPLISTAMRQKFDLDP